MTPPPALIPFNQEWDEYLNNIYEHYLGDIVHNKLHYQGKPINARYNPETDGKGFSFWHVISEGQFEEERLPDLRRCERIRWIRWAIVGAIASDAAVLVYKNHRTTKRGTTVRTIFFVEEMSYVVILEERKDFFLLVSAYPVDERRAGKLKKEWADYHK
ncbi:hypothetical protein WH367_07155 [Comamonas sp. MYb21]|uniref:hypothetical protein n=1 Tax=Comamonas sp. MYb21 TaxID=1848648 RepID=UPI0030ADCB13